MEKTRQKTRYHFLHTCIERRHESPITSYLSSAIDCNILKDNQYCSIIFEGLFSVVHTLALTYLGFETAQKQVYTGVSGAGVTDIAGSVIESGAGVTDIAGGVADL